MTNNELTFMTLSCVTSDAHEDGSVFIGDVAPFLATLSHKGINEKEVWRCQLSLKRAGYIRLFANYNVEDVDPNWSQAAPEFEITPRGLRWWLMLRYGKEKYATMVNDIKSVEPGISLVSELTEKLKLPLVLIQKIMYAENHS